MSKEFIGLKPNEVIEYDPALGEETVQKRIEEGTDNYEGSSVDGFGKGEENE